jgi:hypothetical protein
LQGAIRYPSIILRMKKPPKKPAASKKATVSRPKSSPKGKGRLKKIALRTLLVLLVLVILMPVAHYFVFPQQTRSILIDYSSFKKEGQLYVDAKTPQNLVDSLDELITRAGRRVDRFWDGKTCNPKFIYCESDADFAKFGSDAPVPAVTIMKLGSYVVLSKDGRDLDIIAHEIAHAELYERIGFYAQEFKIPTWFSEGLAMQCDDRDYYSEDTLRAKSDNFKNLPDVKKFKSAGEFHAGSHEAVMLNYMTAKHEVKEWYTPEKLQDFIAQLNAGASFEEAYGQSTKSKD